MADDKDLAALEAARAAMIEAIAEYKPIAARELARIAVHHIQKCWDDFDVAREIWDEAFVEGERLVRKTHEAPRPDKI